MTWFEVDSVAVAQGSAAARACADEVAAEVEAMTRHLAGLRGSWRGPAATAFEDVVARWRATQEEVTGSLSAIQAALAEAGRGYDAAEASARRMFGA